MYILANCVTKENTTISDMCFFLFKPFVYLGRFFVWMVNKLWSQDTQDGLVRLYREQALEARRLLEVKQLQAQIKQELPALQRAHAAAAKDSLVEGQQAMGRVKKKFLEQRKEDAALPQVRPLDAEMAREMAEAMKGTS